MVGQAVFRQIAATAGDRVLTTIPKRTLIPHKSSNHIAGMPRVRIPFAEKVACGLFISGAILFTPTWILLHLKEYKGQ